MEQLTKTCSKCLNALTLENFHKCAKGRYGRVSVCKSCRHACAQSHKMEKSFYDKRYRKQESEKIREYQKLWSNCNKEKRADYQRTYREKHKEKVNINAAQYVRKKLSTNLEAKLAHNIRKRLYRAIKSKKYSSVDALGCSIKQLKEHLESQFQHGMTWENYGEWHIDHIRPLASFDLQCREQFEQACHYTNLQPLWAVDNIAKGDRYANK